MFRSLQYTLSVLDRFVGILGYPTAFNPAAPTSTGSPAHEEADELGVVAMKMAVDREKDTGQTRPGDPKKKENQRKCSKKKQSSICLC